MLRVLLAGGGTAGHVNPALAIAEIIRDYYPDTKFLFAGTPNGMEATLVRKAGYNFAPIKVAGIQRSLSIDNIKRNAKALYYLALSGIRAKQILKDFKPDLVIGTGGYVSGPIVLKASEMGIKTAIHEQNAFPGVTTKLLSKHVDRIMLTVEDAKKHLDPKYNYTVTGLPVRKAFLNISKEDARRQLGFDNAICILSTGGSLGAGKLNDTVADLLTWFEDNNIKVNYIHNYGKAGKEDFLKKINELNININKESYIIKEYIDNMPACMAAADLVITRCGAGALCEIENIGVASILVPSPFVAENHQYHNGMVLQNANAGIVIEQKDLTGKVLIETVKELVLNKQKLIDLGKNAKKLAINDTNERIFSVLSQLINS